MLPQYLEAQQTRHEVVLMPDMFFYLAQKLGPPTNRFDSDELICGCIAMNYKAAASPTNLMYYRMVPFPYEYDFRLFDENGREVRKTAYGLANSKEPVKPKSRVELARFNLSGASRGFEMFRADDLFAITNSGTYDIFIRIRLCIPLTNGLPDFKLITNLSKFAFDRDYSHWNIIESQPFHAKIVKRPPIIFDWRIRDASGLLKN